MSVTSFKNIKHIIYGGFGSILFLMLSISIIGSYQARMANEAMAKIVEENTLKVEYAHSMREAIRLRQSSMNLMIALKDPFKRDAERMRFYNHARIYREAREKLFHMPMTDKEKQLHVRIKEATRAAQPLNNQVADLMTENADPEILQKNLQRARSAQYSLLDLLTELIDLQKQYAHASLMKGRKNYDQSLLIVSLFATCGFIIACIIILYISRYVSTRNEELLMKNEELADASQRALDATRAKSEFLASMSHEIRTPLTSIIGYAEASLDKDLTTDDRTSSVKTIIRSGKHLLQLINDILDLSKIEANKLDVARVSFNLFELLADIELLMSGRAKEKGLEFMVEHIYPLPEQIYSDPLRLKQILVNLCGNAIKFTSEGHIIIKVNYDAKSGNLKFVVADTGIGMTPEQHQKIFKAYTQADLSTTRNYGGTGLGLKLTSEFITMLDGEISVDSIPGLGSRFVFTVHAGVDENVELVEEDSQVIINRYFSNDFAVAGKLNGHVLLAEDNPDNRRLLSMFINNMGISVDVTENGKMAVDRALTANYDVVLMDMQMPVLNGIEATKSLRREGYTKPVIALTASAMTQDREMCYKAGCDDFIAKPVDRMELHATLAKYLSGVDCREEEPPVLSALLKEDPEYISIVGEFLQNLPVEISNVKLCIENKEWNKLKHIAHQLKGSGGGFGYPALTEIASKLENVQINNESTELYNIVKELEDAVDRIIGDFQQYLLLIDKSNIPGKSKIRA